MAIRQNKRLSNACNRRIHGMFRSQIGAQRLALPSSLGHICDGLMLIASEAIGAKMVVVDKAAMADNMSSWW